MAKENEFYLQLLQQALPLEQQAMSMQQIQPQMQPQTQQVTASLEQHVKTQTHKLSPQYNPSPEKSRGSLYLLSTIVPCEYSIVIMITRIFMFLFVLLEGNNNSIETNVQNGGVHTSSLVTSQTQTVTTKSTHRKSLDKSEKQEEQHNKHNVSNNSPSDKSDKKFIHSNGSTVSHSDIQLIERVGYGRFHTQKCISL